MINAKEQLLQPVDDWGIDAIAQDLQAARGSWRSAHRNDARIREPGFPSRQALEKIASLLAGALFPVRLGPSTLRAGGEEAFVVTTLQSALDALFDQVRLELIARTPQKGIDTTQQARAIVRDFGQALPEIRRLLDTDVEAAFAGDPAAESVDEVLLCYPCVLAILHHRLAHSLHGLGARLVARILSEIAHSATGIDIHPGATIGSSFFIDHGTGVVIGQTAIVGRRVRIYQAVTLGARSFPTGEDGSLIKGAPRHPIVEDDVVIYAGATILGRVTIGAGAVIGGNVWLTEDVPPGSVIHQACAEREYASRSRLPTGHVTAQTDAAGS